MNTIVKEWKEQLTEYKKLIAEYEARGLENLNHEDTEYYGAYIGKAEVLEVIIKEMELRYKEVKDSVKEIKDLYQQAKSEKDSYMSSHFKATLMGMERVTKILEK